MLGQFDRVGIGRLAAPHSPLWPQRKTRRLFVERQPTGVGAGIQEDEMKTKDDPDWRKVLMKKRNFRPGAVLKKYLPPRGIYLNAATKCRERIF